MGCIRSTSKLCTALILMAINLVLLSGGILIFTMSRHLRGTGWVRVIEAHWSSANSVLVAMEVVGGVIMGIAALGCLAACCRWRLGLCLYSIIVTIVLLIFAIIAIFSFQMRSEMTSWKGKTYPVKDAEKSVKTQFDRVYCYAQGAYLCNSATISDAVKMFLPEVDAAFLKQFNDVKGVGALCDGFLNTVTELKPVCDGCNMAKQFKNLTDVLDWANEKCPRNDETLVWCGSYLATGGKGTTDLGTAPYSKCRQEFLGLVSSSAGGIGWGGIVVCLGSVLILFFAWYLRRRERQGPPYEEMHTPYTQQEQQQQQRQGYHGAPETQPPIVGTKV